MPRKTTKGGPLKQIYHVSGYFYVTLTRDGKQKRYQVHRLVLLAFEGPPSDGQECRHLDGNSVNNVRSNLTWGTHSENIRDKRQHGTDGNLNKTRCPQGHEYTFDNTLIYKSGSRACRQCAREKGLASYYERKAAGQQVWIPSADLPPDELEKRRARGREQQRRRTAAGLIPKFSELSPEQQEHVRELARERKRLGGK